LKITNKEAESKSKRVKVAEKIKRKKIEA